MQARGTLHRLRCAAWAILGAGLTAGCSASSAEGAGRPRALPPSQASAPQALTEPADPPTESDSAQPALTRPEWRLVFQDEFDGPAGAAPDPSKWVHDKGGSGWGNDELQYYTDSTRNASLDGQGALVVTARAEHHRGRRFTSARLKSLGRFEQAYGRFEARIRVPEGKGIWPAFWLLGSNMDAVDWPECGEIDIMESIGSEPTLVYGTLHGPGYSDDKGVGAEFGLPGGASFADDYHVFAVEWEPEVVRWYVDGALRQSLTPGALPRSTKWVHDHPFFILLNVAVGGWWPGAPDRTTKLPRSMLVDYVRVYERPH
jgi:beta-glucanase (GH16 family)